MAREYRVVWKREGQARRRKIYQTKRAAEEFIRVLDNVEEDYFGHDEPMGAETKAEWERRHAPFTEGPLLESREVGEWGGGEQ